MNTYGAVETTDKTLFMQYNEEESYTISLDDIEKLMIYHDRSNGNVPHTPESTNMIIASILKKDYALKRVFSRNTVDAHVSGDIHIHDLDMPDRSYCSGHSPAYIAKYGLSLPNLNSIAKPPKHADVFLEQIIKFAASMQGHFSGAIGFDAVNMFIAPYIQGLDDAKIKQLAQIIVFEFAQQAVARGGQTIFSDLNLYWEIPKHYRDVPAIGAGGKETGMNYGEYDEESKRFFRALMQVYLEGDASGRPFFFPKPDCHITEESVQDEEYMNILGEVASVRGSPYFVFDRGNDPSISQCCRLKLALSKTDVDEMKIPWKSRFSALQNVSMNMPAMAYQAKDESKFYDILNRNMHLAGQAHMDKFVFFDRLMEMGSEGPLALLSMNHDGDPYVRYDKMKFLIGIVGLNEAVQIICGEQMHESKDALMLGMRMIAKMNQDCKEVAKDIGFTCILEQTPAESTAYRFARLDYKRYGEGLSPFLRGSMDSGGIYYTNSTYINVGANLSPVERVKVEGKFHPMIDAGSLTHVWLGETRPDASSIAAFVKKTFSTTQNAQIAFSPEFTTCMSCNKTTRGLKDNCSYCGSNRVEQMTRVTGFFSNVRGWNRGKVQELKDRHRVVIQ